MTDPKTWVAPEHLRNKAIEATRKLESKSEAKRLRVVIKNASEDKLNAKKV